jgi:hypothetical protein
VSLKEELEQIASAAGVDLVDLDQLMRDEHTRYAWYVLALSQASETAEHDALTAVLHDPDQVMSQAAAVAHIDRMATRELSSAAFAAWARRLGDLLAGHEFARRRVSEWQLFKDISEGTADPELLRHASDWLQRKVAEGATSPAALAVLARDGRTKRIRHIARARSH